MIAWVKGLFQNGVGGASMGRVAFWMVFGGALWTWMVKGVDIANGHLVTLLSMLGYTLTGKFRGVAKTGGTEFDRPGGEARPDGGGK